MRHLLTPPIPLTAEHAGQVVTSALEAEDEIILRLDEFAAVGPVFRSIAAHHPPLHGPPVLGHGPQEAIVQRGRWGPRWQHRRRLGDAADGSHGQRWPGPAVPWETPGGVKYLCACIFCYKY